MLRHTESDLFGAIQIHSDSAVCTLCVPCIQWKRQPKHTARISRHSSLVVYSNIQSMCLCGNGVYFSINDFHFFLFLLRMASNEVHDFRAIDCIIWCRCARAFACLRLLCLLPQNKLLMHIMVCFARTLRLSVCVNRTCRAAAAATAMESESFRSSISILLSVCAVVATTVSISTVDAVPYRSLSTSFR